MTFMVMSRITKNRLSGCRAEHLDAKRPNVTKFVPSRGEATGPNGFRSAGSPAEAMVHRTTFRCCRCSHDEAEVLNVITVRCSRCGLTQQTFAARVLTPSAA